jgi:hypothetical protein
MMKKKNTFTKYISIAIILLVGTLFVAKFGGPSLLKLYVEAGIGTCQKIPVLCMTPTPEIISPEIEKEYTAELLTYEFPTMSIKLPKDFTVIQERIKKVYYKRNKRQHQGNVVYLLHKGPNFFINLFPQLTKQGIKDNYEFIKRTMYADLKGIKNLTDAFFVIMKGIFIPDLGDLKDVKMAQFKLTDRRGFINYNFTASGNYFDCNIMDNAGNFFKIYIKDKGASLNLDKLLAILSSVKAIGESPQ